MAKPCRKRPWQKMEYSFYQQFCIAAKVDDGLTATQAAVSFMPGAWSAGTTIDMLTWVDVIYWITGKIFNVIMPVVQ